MRSNKNEKGFVVIMTVLIVAVVMATYMASIMSTVSGSAKKRAAVRRSFSSDGVFENIAQMIVSGYELKRQVGIGACPANTHLVSIARGTAPAVELCLADACINNPVDANTPICLNAQAPNENPILTFQLKFDESPAVAWLTDKVEERWISRDLQGLPRANAQVAFKNSLPPEPGGAPFDPAGPPILINTMCEAPAGEDFKCLTIKICLNRLPCSGVNEEFAIFQRIGFNP